MERSWDTGLPVVCGGIVGVWLGCVRGASEASDFERARFSWLHVGLARAVENGGLRGGGVCLKVAPRGERGLRPGRVSPGRVSPGLAVFGISGWLAWGRPMIE